jgi:hypothetical protein
MKTSLLIALLFLGAGAVAQTVLPSAAELAAIREASIQEREREMKLLGISEMRKPLTAYDIGKPGNANYDEALANPTSSIPDLMVMQNGAKVTTAAEWQKRRAELKLLFDDNVYGRYPARIPKVTWHVDGVDNMDVEGVSAIVKRVTGHVDNSDYPAITVDIKLEIVTPAAAKGRKVPVIMGGGLVHPRPPRPAPLPGQPVHLMSAPTDSPDSAKLLLDKGWGFVTVNNADVQADNAAGLDKGIIGLVNKGQKRSLSDWGVLRAWAWVHSKAIDYLQTDPDVNAKAVGIVGHSRGGKAAMVAMVDDPRIAVGFISSSGAGGAAPYRRNYGESTANLTAPNEFHWFAGNFLKYGAAGHSANEMPVDAHQFIALVAPRAVFIGGGALITDPDYAPGDAWQDAQGMFMAAVAASPAWEIQGRKGLGTDSFPAMETTLDSGAVAFRQHRYGHTPAPNWPAFIQFASRYLK